MKQLSKNWIKLGVSHWLPLSAEKLAGNKDKLEWLEARAARQATDDDVRVDFTCPEHMTGVGQVYAMIYNFVGDSDAMWISTDEKNHPMVTQAMYYMFALFNERDVKAYITVLDPIDRLHWLITLWLV